MVVALALDGPIGIANLLGNRHNNVMQPIERLAMRGVTDIPAMTENPYTQPTAQQSVDVRWL